MPEINNLNRFRELAARHIPNPRSSVSHHYHLFCLVVPVPMRQRPKERLKMFHAPQRGRVGAALHSRITPALVLFGFVNDTRFTFRPPAYKVPLAAVFLPAISHRHHRSVQAHIQTTRPGSLPPFIGECLLLMPARLLLLRVPQRSAG